MDTGGQAETVILDPTPEEHDVVEARLANRPKSLSGKVLGLLANGKPNSLPFMEVIAELLGSRFGLAGVVKQDRAKGAKSDLHAMDRRPREPDALIMEFAEKCDVVLSGVGD